MKDSRKKPVAFVPRIVMTGIVGFVIPTAALEACSSSSSSGPNAIPLAQQAFDSGADADANSPDSTIIVALAMQGFDAGLDSEASDDGNSADADTDADGS